MTAAVRRILPLLLAALMTGVCGWSQDERVLLREVQAITLHNDRYTTARRAAAVPQLKCMGGSAGCRATELQVVQCYNRGWDGVDVQWECKVEMDSAYRFGKIEVSCEGYEYPADPYILRGSCGLEYTLELSEEGRRRSQGGYRDKSSDWSSQHSYGSEILQYLVILGLAYGVYKLFLSGPSGQQQQHPNPDDYGHEHQTYSQASAPPPPGFKENVTGASSGFGNFGTSSSGSWTNQRPGFWTGLGSGLGLGYLFGSQRPRTDYFSHYSSYTPHDSMWGRPSFHRPSHSTPSVGTTSGFGGTKRR